MFKDENQWEIEIKNQVLHFMLEIKLEMCMMHFMHKNQCSLTIYVNAFECLCEYIMFYIQVMSDVAYKVR